MRAAHEGTLSRAADTATDVLVLVVVICLLGFLALGVVGLVRAIVRVTHGKQVFVSPFKGSDERRGELTALFARRLVEVEDRWIALAREIQHLRDSFGQSSTDAALPTHAPSGGEPMPDAPISEGVQVAAAPRTRFSDVAAGPRTTGDEQIEIVLAMVSDEGSLSDVDFGVVTVAGVSFSPQAFLAFFRLLPGSVARRRLHGIVTKTGARHVMRVSFEDRSQGRAGRRPYSVSHVALIDEENWIKGMDEVAFALTKKRLTHLGEHKETTESASLPPQIKPSTTSQTVALAEIEAESWEACQAFLEGYTAQLRHYRSGAASDRDEALIHYARALEAQPWYTRAAYNYATLLYNRYLPRSNREALKRFREATESRDSRVRALALAGMAMAHCQAIHRFGETSEEAVKAAVSASQQALILDPNLEEARFAVAWASQAEKAWDRALREYDSTVALESSSPPGNRIKSFAHNNAGWIWLEPLRRRSGALAKAETHLWQALTHYPNKVAYVNLAEVARRSKRYDDALRFFDRALRLDPDYVNAWNERACLEIEIAGDASAASDRETQADLVHRAGLHHARAVELAGDPVYAARLERQFTRALGKHRPAASGRQPSKSRPVPR